MNRDTDVHRCDACGTWCVTSRPCTTCALGAYHQLATPPGTWVRRPGGIRIYQQRTAA